MKDAYIYLRVDGQSCKPLPVPQNSLGQDLILIQVKSWVKSLRGFDPYDSALSIRVIDSEGNALYSLNTGHAYDVCDRVEFAIARAKANAAEKVA